MGFMSAGICGTWLVITNFWLVPSISRGRETVFHWQCHICCCICCSGKHILFWRINCKEVLLEKYISYARSMDGTDQFMFIYTGYKNFGFWVKVLFMHKKKLLRCQRNFNTKLLNIFCYSYQESSGSLQHACSASNMNNYIFKYSGYILK